MRTKKMIVRAWTALLAVCFFSNLASAEERTKINCENREANLVYEYVEIDFGYDLYLKATWSIDGKLYHELSSDLSDELSVVASFSPVNYEAAAIGELAYSRSVELRDYFDQILYSGQLACTISQ